MSDHPDHRIGMRPRNAPYSDPVGLGAQGDLMGVPEPVSSEIVLADQIGGSFVCRQPAGAIVAAKAADVLRGE